MARDLTRELLARGHQALVVSGTINTPWECPHIPLPLHRRNYPKRIQNILSLNAIVRSFRPHLLHAHSRASSWVATFTSRTAAIPLVVSVHQLLPGGLSKRLLPALGDRTLVICEEVAFHLQRHFPVRQHRLEVLRNGLDLSLYSPKPLSKGKGTRGKRIGILGRQSGPKGESTCWFIREVLPLVNEEISAVELHIAGKEDPRVAEEAERCNRALGKRAVRLVGVVDDVPSFIASCDLMVAAGRAALESMACGRPLIALGERASLGLVDVGNIALAQATNFGDCSSQKLFDAGLTSAGAVLALTSESTRRRLSRFGREVVESEHDIKKAVDRLEGIYRGLLKGRRVDGLEEMVLLGKRA